MDHLSTKPSFQRITSLLVLPHFDFDCWRARCGTGWVCDDDARGKFRRHGELPNSVESPDEIHTHVLITQLQSQSGHHAGKDVTAGSVESPLDDDDESETCLIKSTLQRKAMQILRW